MKTNTLDGSHAWSGRSDREGPPDAARLIPVVTRAAELGRGPPWLVGWVRGQLTGRTAIRDPSVARRLAGDLARLLRPSGLVDTIRDRV